MKLRDRKAFITGASRGIGRAIALAFAKEGAVLALGARSMDSLEKLAAEIEADGGKAVPIQIDVGSGSSIADAQAAVGEKLGDIYIVVNNAGIARSVKVLDMDDEHWQSHLDINLTGTFRVTRAFLPGLVAEGWGRVINIASTAGKVCFQYTAAYCASKHGVIGLTRALDLEMASENVTVNAICPELRQYRHDVRGGQKHRPENRRERSGRASMAEEVFAAESFRRARGSRRGRGHARLRRRARH